MAPSLDRQRSSELGPHCVCIRKIVIDVSIRNLAQAYFRARTRVISMEKRTNRNYALDVSNSEGRSTERGRFASVIDWSRSFQGNTGRAIQSVPVSRREDNPSEWDGRWITYGWRRVQTTTTYRVTQPNPAIDQIVEDCYQTRLTASDALYNAPMWPTMLPTSSLMILRKRISRCPSQTCGSGDNLSLKDITSSSASFILALRFFFMVGVSDDR